MFRLELVKTIELDNYKEGCDLDSFQDLGIIDTLTDATLEGLKAKLKRQYSIDKFELVEIDTDETYLGSSILENEQGDVASAKEIELFQKGEIDLYNATYSIYLFKVEITSLKPDCLLS